MKRREFIKAGLAGALALNLPAAGLFAQTLQRSEHAAMPRITLNNGVHIPILGYGTWNVRGAEGQKAIETALELGYRHIDTAAMYNNEDIVGAAVKASGIPRSEIFITSKIWSDMSRAGAQRTFEASAQKLGLDHVDLYLLHHPGGDIDGAWAALSDLYRQGRIKALGVSNFDAGQIQAFYKRVAIKPVLNQIELNPLQQQRDVRRAMQEIGVAVQSYSPFGGSSGSREMLQLPALVQIAARHGKTPAQIILRWLVQQNIIAIPKTMRRERMLENISVFDFALDEGDMQSIAGLAQDR